MRCPITLEELAIPPLSTLVLGSLPRPDFQVASLLAFKQKQIGELEYQATANDAVIICIDGQLRWGADVICDGEQRREDYATFFLRKLNNLRFAEGNIFIDGPLSRRMSLTGNEFRFTRSYTVKPIKIALPGPYLLSRLLFAATTRGSQGESTQFAPSYYADRASLAFALVQLLVEEIAELLESGTAMVQINETLASDGPSPLSGHPGAKFTEAAQAEVNLQVALLQALTANFPAERLAINFEPVFPWDILAEAPPALGFPIMLYTISGTIILQILRGSNFGTVFLDFTGPAASWMPILPEIPKAMRIGAGLVDARSDALEGEYEVEQRLRFIAHHVGIERLLVTTGTGFAPFALGPQISLAAAERKISLLSQCANKLNLQV